MGTILAYSILREVKEINKMGNWQKEEEHKRYGDLLEKAQEEEKQKQKDTLKAIENVIEWAEQSSKERDEEWRKKKEYRNNLLDKAKKRMNREYNI